MPSSVILHFEYNQHKATLRVRFVSGVLYEYKDVPEETYRAMKKAFSKGTFLNQFIKGQYACERVEE